MGEVVRWGKVGIGAVVGAKVGWSSGAPGCRLGWWVCGGCACVRV